MKYEPYSKGPNPRELMKEDYRIGIPREASSLESVREFLQDKAASWLVYGKSGFCNSQDVVVLEDEASRMFFLVISGYLLKSRELEDWRQYGSALRKEAEGIGAWEKDNMYWPSEKEFSDLKNRKRV